MENKRQLSNSVSKDKKSQNSAQILMLYKAHKVFMEKHEQRRKEQEKIEVSNLIVSILNKMAKKI